MIRSIWATLFLFMVVLLATPVFAASQGFVVASCPGTLGVNAYTPGQYGNITVDVNGNTCTSGGAAGLPTGATQIGGTFSGADTTTAAATLAAAPAGHTTYICGFTVSGLGSTAGGPVTVTVATLVGATTLSYSYVFAAGVAVANTPLAVSYSPCIAANATATAITVTVPGQAGNTATQINATGYQL